MNRFVDAHAPRGRVASRAPRRAPLEPAPLPNRLRHVRVRAPCPRLNTPRNAPRLKDCRRPPDRPPQSQPTFVAERRWGDFPLSTERATLYAAHTRNYDVSHATTLLMARWKLSRRTLLRARAQATYCHRYPTAYGHCHSRSEALYSLAAESVPTHTTTRPYQWQSPLTSSIPPTWGIVPSEDLQHLDSPFTDVGLRHSYLLDLRSCHGNFGDRKTRRHQQTQSES